MPDAPLTADPAEAPLAPPLSAQAYARCFGAFRERSTEWKAMLRWCRERLPLWLPQKPDFRAMSVGPGNGDFDWRLLPVLADHRPGLEYVLVEPSPAMCRTLRKRMAAEPVPGVDLELDPEGFECCPDHRAFDLVLLTHCLYYIPDKAAALKRALCAAGENGLGLVFHQTELGINQVQQRFLGRVKGSEKEMFTSREIAAMLDEIKAPYKLRELESHIDVTDCLIPGSKEGEDVLSFFLESDFRALDPEVQDEILDCLNELADQTNGRRLLHHPVAVFTLGDESPRNSL